MKTKASQLGPQLLLLAEDDEAMRSLLFDEFFDMGFRIIEATSGDQALQYVLANKPDVILTDLRMPQGGIEYVSRLRSSAPDVPIVVMTAYGDSRTKPAAFALGVAAYFDKPVRISDLKVKVEELLNAAG